MISLGCWGKLPERLKTVTIITDFNRSGSKWKRIIREVTYRIYVCYGRLTAEGKLITMFRLVPSNASVTADRYNHRKAYESKARKHADKYTPRNNQA